MNSELTSGTANTVNIEYNVRREKRKIRACQSFPSTARTEVQCANNRHTVKKITEEERGTEYLINSVKGEVLKIIQPLWETTGEVIMNKKQNKSKTRFRVRTSRNRKGMVVNNGTHIKQGKTSKQEEKGNAD
jgi:hypothetical protein